MNSDQQVSDPLAATQAFFIEQGLPFPPLPDRMVSALRPASEFLFATCPVEAAPFDAALWVSAVTASTPPYAVLGVDGRGFNSWAMHYFLVDGPLALFVQCPWGGAFGDAEADRAAIEVAFEQCARLQAAARRAQTEGRVKPGQRLVVAHGPLLYERCDWWSPDVAEPESDDPDALPPWPGAGYATVLERASALFDELPGV